MLEYLFGSKTRIKILKLFFRHSNKSYYVREISRLLNAQINATRRELELLKKIDLLIEAEGEIKEKTQAEDANETGVKLRKYYRLNQSCIFYPELKALLAKENLTHQNTFTEEIKKRAGDIKLFVITGHFTADTKAPTDLLLVGKIKNRNLEKIIKDYEKEFGIELRYTVMSEDEFADRRYVLDKFLFAIFAANHKKIVNKFDNI